MRDSACACGVEEEILPFFYCVFPGDVFKWCLYLLFLCIVLYNMLYSTLGGFVGEVGQG